MAFATSNVSNIPLGNGKRLTMGQWTGSVGDATGTIKVTGAKVYGFQVWENSSGAYLQAPVSYTVSGNVITLTVENIATVSDGTFFIIHG